VVVSPVEEPTVLQRIAQRSGGVVTPANLLDGLAFVGAAWSGPRFETWGGIAVGAFAYLSDVVDGTLARATGTESSVGELVDHVGDKPKVAFALWHIWRRRLAGRRLVAAVAAYNLVTASITVFDRLANETPRIEVTREGKRAMFTTATGIGVQVVASKLRSSHPVVSRTIEVSATSLGYAGLVLYGLPTIGQYYRMATGSAPSTEGADEVLAPLGEQRFAGERPQDSSGGPSRDLASS
jgi:phosphatidylglycerophosphate synthase